ncbi:hypothetical protein RF11_09607 [Thelohanellus kitauei]|uniref:Uncharacterized protein n=1 Tax=Thelohanellus kitauei TaxID=669202 RepID=A0A0C2MF22_THEKT|nr:hypothetical protein RF11_09607 [Thelohanellus kitauei]
MAKLKGATDKKVEADKHKLIDFFDEESRQNIYRWSAKRFHKEQKSYWYRMKIYMINFKMIKTFFDGITLMVVLCVGLTCVFTFICHYFKVQFNFQASIIVSPLVFPLSFLIRGI